MSQLQKVLLEFDEPVSLGAKRHEPGEIADFSYIFDYLDLIRDKTLDVLPDTLPSQNQPVTPN